MGVSKKWDQRKTTSLPDGHVGLHGGWEVKQMQSSVIAASLWAPDEKLRARLWPLQQHLDGTAATFGIWEGFGNGSGGISAILHSSRGVIVGLSCTCW